jgi:hypothetical protein
MMKHTRVWLGEGVGLGLRLAGGDGDARAGEAVGDGLGRTGVRDRAVAGRGVAVLMGRLAACRPAMGARRVGPSTESRDVPAAAHSATSSSSERRIRIWLKASWALRAWGLGRSDRRQSTVRDTFRLPCDF